MEVAARLMGLNLRMIVRSRRKEDRCVNAVELQPEQRRLWSQRSKQRGAPGSGFGTFAYKCLLGSLWCVITECAGGGGMASSAPGEAAG